MGLCLLVGVGAVLGYYALVPGVETATNTPRNWALAETGTALAQTSTALAWKPSHTPTVPESSPTWTATMPVETAPPSATLVPSSTPLPSATATLIPSATGVYATWQPCAGSYPSRLHVGDRAYISYDPPLPNRVRSEPNTVAAVIGYLQVGERMEIIDGPICNSGWVWWRVRSLDTAGLVGWTAEGDESGYWLVPLP